MLEASLDWGLEKRLPSVRSCGASVFGKRLLRTGRSTCGGTSRLGLLRTGRSVCGVSRLGPLLREGRSSCGSGLGASCLAKGAQKGVLFSDFFLAGRGAADTLDLRELAASLDSFFGATFAVRGAFFGEAGLAADCRFGRLSSMMLEIGN